jgi:uncharacterized protein (TIGR02246 family)
LPDAVETKEESPVLSPEETEVRDLYHRLIDAWNQRDAAAMAAPFAEDGELIGFDGSEVICRAAIVGHLEPIFASHPTPPYLTKVKSVRFLSPDVAVLRAVAGMVPPGKTDIEPKVNTHHTVVAARRDGRWQIALYQNTPAQFHGRPDLVEQMTAELRELLK